MYEYTVEVVQEGASLTLYPAPVVLVEVRSADPVAAVETTIPGMIAGPKFVQAVIVDTGTEPRPSSSVVLWIAPAGVVPVNAISTDLISTGGNVTGGGTATTYSHLALDTDGVPYYDSAGGSSDIYVKTDTDGVRYYSSTGPSDSHLVADTDGVPYYATGA